MWVPFMLLFFARSYITAPHCFFFFFLCIIFFIFQIPLAHQQHFFLLIDNIVLLGLTHHNIHTLASPTVLLARSLHIHTHSQNCTVRTLQSLKAFLPSLSLSPKSSFFLYTTSLSPGWIDMIANVTTTRIKKRKRLKTLFQSVLCIYVYFTLHTTAKQAIMWLVCVVYDCLNVVLDDMNVLKLFNNLKCADLEVNQWSWLGAHRTDAHFDTNYLKPCKTYFCI